MALVVMIDSVIAKTRYPIKEDGAKYLADDCDVYELMFFLRRKSSLG